MKTLTGVGAIMSAAHKTKDGKMHGHTWEIVAWFSGQPDAVAKQRELQQALLPYDHNILDDSMAWGEQLGQVLIKSLGCVKVDINRQLERIYAVVEL